MCPKSSARALRCIPVCVLFPHTLAPAGVCFSQLQLLLSCQIGRFSAQQSFGASCDDNWIRCFLYERKAREMMRVIITRFYLSFSCGLAFPSGVISVLMTCSCILFKCVLKKKKKKKWSETYLSHWGKGTYLLLTPIMY